MYRPSGTSARRTGRAMSVLCSKAFDQLCHRLAAMADVVLAFRFQLGRTGAFRFDPEQRVVTEAAAAARRLQDAAAPHALADDGRRILGVARGDDAAVEGGRALGIG